MKKFLFREKEFDVSKENRFIFDEEVRDFLPPIPASDYEMLKEDLKHDGLRHAITIWKEEGILIDGYHRYFGCTSQGITVDKVEYLSFPDRAQMLLWVLKNQNERRGSQTLYWRCMKALDKRIVYALHDKGKRIKSEMAKIREAKKRGEKIADSCKLHESAFDARKEQLNLAGTDSTKYLSKVKYIEDDENKKYWNKVIRAIRAELIHGMSNSVVVDGKTFNVSLEEVHRQTKTAVTIGKGIEDGTLSEKALAMVPFESRADFLKVIEEVGEEDATLEIQEEVAERCKEDDDFDFLNINMKFNEIIEEKKEDEKKKKKKKAEQKKEDIDKRIEKLHRKLLQTSTKLNDTTEEVRVIDSHMTNLLRKASDYGIPHEEIYSRINEKTKAVFQIAAYCLVAHLKEMFGDSVHGIKEDSVKFLPQNIEENCKVEEETKKSNKKRLSTDKTS